MKSLLTFDTVGHRRMDIAVPPPPYAKFKAEA